MDDMYCEDEMCVCGHAFEDHDETWCCNECGCSLFTLDEDED